jgi:hypothetical protein
MRHLATILITLALVVLAMSIELFRYRGAAKDGGALEYAFEGGELNSPNAVTKEKGEEIAADFTTTFYHIQVGALETQEFRTAPVPFWIACFSDTVKGPIRIRFSVVLLKKIVPSLYCRRARSHHAIRICRSLRRGWSLC